METHDFDLGRYLSGGVANIVKRALRATLSDPKESAFMARFALASRDASERRAKAQANGKHIPPFLIAGITDACNLRCKGCYAQCRDVCSNAEAGSQLTEKDWTGIFAEARELGITFILLAGGEPLLRRDVLNAAGNFPDILFPVFTNGTLLDDSAVALFDQKRNLFPVLSIEGQQKTTDKRRGEGIYSCVEAAMRRLSAEHLIFGVSVTVTADNLREVTETAFLDDLQNSGCKAVFYVEYVPVAEGSEGLALRDTGRAYLQDRLGEIREAFPDIVFLSFPGDEKSSGGCLAAGRGFFYINADGDAQPCPFSPYSDSSVKNSSISRVLDSPLFTALRGNLMLTHEHSGGCVLFEHRADVEALAAQGTQSDAGR